MIVEDEHGNQVDLNDSDDHEPDPTPEDEPTLDLDEIEAAFATSLKESCVLGEHGMRVLDAVPHLIAEVERLRERLAAWEAMPVEYRHIEEAGRTLRQTVHLGPLEELHTEPPF